MPELRARVVLAATMLVTAAIGGAAPAASAATEGAGRAGAIDSLRLELLLQRPGIPDAGGCASVRRTCVLVSRSGTELQVVSTPPAAFSGARVRLERRWRRPGTRSRLERAPLRASLGAGAVATTLSLARLATDPGAWCLRAIVDTADGHRIASPVRCVRWRPPITVGWAGDIVVGSSHGLPPDGGRDQLAAVHHLLRRPDLMVGNYEGTLSRGGRPRCSGGPRCWIFQAPPERARNLARAGFDVMSLANNHALDMGVEARNQSVAALRRVGVRAAGLPGQVVVEQVADTRVAIVGISPYPGTTSMRDERAVRELVARATRAADVVLVTMHVGLEGARGAHVPRGLDYGTPTRRIAHAALDAGAHAVVGSGPHVVRGIERWAGRYVVYSTGNFAGWWTFALGGPSSQSGVVELRFDHHGRTLEGRWNPVVLHGPGIPLPDRSGRVLRRVSALSVEDFGARGVHLATSGRFR